MQRALVLNGPNLDTLGSREPHIYGDQTLADIEQACREHGSELGLEVVCRQTNAEAQMIDWLRNAASEAGGIVMNAGAWTHYSLAIRDGVALAGLPVVEVHISNIYAREAFRSHSVISPVAAGVIVGLGAQGYLLALNGLAKILEARS